MRVRQIFHAFFWSAIFLCMVVFFLINFSWNFPKERDRFLGNTISLLEKGIEIVDDFREKDRNGKREASAIKGVVNARGEEDVVNPRDEEDVVNPRGEEDVVNARGEEGVINPREKEGVVNTREKEGVVNTRKKEGVVNTREKEGNANTRKRDSSDYNKVKDPIKINQPVRQSVLAIGHDRSGTTFINRMFDQDPNIFNVYEPLWIVKGIGSPENYRDAIMDVLNGIFNCNFTATDNGVKFLAGISNWIAVRLHSKAMMSYPFCTNKPDGERVCWDMSKTPRHTDKVCATKYKYSVTKLATPRIPDRNISSILPRALEENPGARVLFMVRDPRGSINSRINAKWMKDYPDPNLEPSIKSICDTTAYNLQYMQRLMGRSEFRDRCMIVYYKDITANPLAMAKKMYKFARFRIEPRLTEWIMNTTKPDEKRLKLELYNPYSIVRNSTGNDEKWRKESPVERVRLINKLCAPLLRMLERN